MSKVAIVYWSGTGNTEAMANAVAEGAGAEGTLLPCALFDASQIGDYDAFAFGCPAMGSEELEYGEFGPMFDGVVGALAGKKVGLFGSYGWGDGEWMRSWQEQVAGAGAELVADGVTANYEPDDGALAACRELGAALAG